MSTTLEHKKVTAPALIEMKKRGEKIAMLTAYDFLFGKILDDAGLDILLVGDSGAMVFSGFEKFKLKFVRRYVELGQSIREAAEQYARDVKARQFSNSEESF